MQNDTAPTRRAALGLLAIAATAVPSLAHIDLLYPAGGETFQAGDSVQIEWHINTEHDTTDFDLWYSVTGEVPWTPIVIDLVVNDFSAGTTHTWDWVVPDAPSASVRVQVRQDNVIDMDYWDTNFLEFTIVSPCPAPTTYCVTSPNSVGAGAELTYSGSIGIGVQDLRLHVEGGPPGATGVFFYGAAPDQVPFGAGVRCIAGRHFRMLAPVTINAQGGVQRLVPFDQAPLDAGAGHIAPQSTWYFQFWYLDPVAGGPNLSDALEATFCP